MSIKKELLAATAVQPVEGETKQALYVRIAKAANKLAEDAWDALSSEAQDWAAAAAEEINAAKSEGGRATAIAGFPKKTEAPEAEEPTAESDDAEGEDEATEPEVEKTEEVSEEETKPMKKSKTEEAPKAEAAPKAEKPAKAPKAEKPAKAPKAEKKPRTLSLRAYVYQTVLVKPTIMKEKVKVLALAKGFDVTKNSFLAYYRDAVSFLAIADRAGYVIVKKAEQAE